MTILRGRARIVIVTVVVLLAIVAIANVASPVRSQDGSDERTAKEVKLVLVNGSETQRLWPYTSRQKDFDTLTLPINAMVYEDAGTVYQLLAAGQGGTRSQWETTNPENETIVLNETEASWSRSHGATRYTYVDTPQGGRWLDETYQLHDGSYFGTRYHLRLYEGGTRPNRWTAIQAHAEHWDWFRLRHTVSGLSEARQHVEHDFYGTSYLRGIERKRYANGGIFDADGWISAIRVADWTTHGPQTLWPVAVGLTLTGVPASLWATWDRSYVDSRHLSLLFSTASIPLAVRIGGIALEQHTPLGGTPKVIAAALFPILAVGLPVIVHRLGRELRAEEGFVLSALGLGAGFVADYAFLGITVLPLAVVLHRLTLLVALGLVAAGGVRWSDEWLVRNQYGVAGVGIWVAALLWTLLGLG